MIEKILFYRTSSLLPWPNQALEAWFTEIAKPGQLIFYLWQNDHTVVIGRNQDALAECLADELEESGGYLARRLSGGGAVYHDQENLNFTFALHEDDYDTLRQTDVILSAVKALGIEAERTGRNDLTIDGRKFSGHSYYRHKKSRFHNGTLMVQTDTAKMQRYLTVSPDKLNANRVQSVRSRVINLREAAPDLTVDALAQALREALQTVYCVEAEDFSPADFDWQRIEFWERFFTDRDWRFGRDGLDRSGGWQAEQRFGWGKIALRFTPRNNCVTEPLIVSDALEASWLAELTERWTGLPARCSALCDAVAVMAEAAEADVRAPEMRTDIIELLKTMPWPEN